MSLLLNVPYLEKDEAKKLGAQWDSEKKKWFSMDFMEHLLFTKWIPKESTVIICDNLFVLEGKVKCYKCGKETRVVGFGIQKYCEIEYEMTAHYRVNSLLLQAEILPMPVKLLAFLKSKYNFRYSYSKTVKKKYYANMCDHCNALQGKNYLFEEVNSPFFDRNHDSLVIKRLRLEYDLSAEMELDFCNIVSLEGHEIQEVNIII